MTTEYQSSIVTKYGDVANVRADVKTLHDILGRQGSSLLIDVIAEHVGVVAIKFNLNKVEKNNLLKANIDELTDAILERI